MIDKLLRHRAASRPSSIRWDSSARIVQVQHRRARGLGVPGRATEVADGQRHHGQRAPTRSGRSLVTRILVASDGLPVRVAGGADVALRHGERGDGAERPSSFGGRPGTVGQDPLQRLTTGCELPVRLTVQGEPGGEHQRRGHVTLVIDPPIVHATAAERCVFGRSGGAAPHRRGQRHPPAFDFRFALEPRRLDCGVVAVAQTRDREPSAGRHPGRGGVVDPLLTSAE